MNHYSFYLSFILGLFSTAHCMWMCGGIIGALTISVGKVEKRSKQSLFFYLLAYNTGRITGYVVAGTVASLIGSIFLGVFNQNYVRHIVRVFVSFLMLAIGLYLAGWFPKFALLEAIGKPLWKVVEPLGKKMLPVSSLSQAFFFGVIWGWIPCGLSYSVMLWASTFSSVYEGAMLMLFFGLGTLLPVMTAGLFTGLAVRLTSLRYADKIVAMAFIFFSILNMVYLAGAILKNYSQ